MKSIHEEETHKRTRQNAQDRPKLEINLTWVASYMGSKGNEAADELAKEAAEFSSSSDDLLPLFLHRKLPSSLAAVKQQIGKFTKREMIIWWKKSKRYKRIKAINPSFPSLKFIKATKEVNCKQISILTQICTGHIPLNGHLHQINKSNTPYCTHCPNITEDVLHLLFHCNKYTTQRQRLILAVERKAFNTQHILSNPAAICHTLNYINSTGRFKHIFGDISAELMVVN